MYLMTQKGYNLLVSTFHTRSRKIEVSESLTVKHLFPTKEDSCLTVLESAFQQYTSIREFQIAGYRIDLYFPELKLAVECDEYGHSGRKAEHEAARQIVIEQEMHCRFIRFNPDEEGFNIGNVIAEIFSQSVVV